MIRARGWALLPVMLAPLVPAAASEFPVDVPIDCAIHPARTVDLAAPIDGVLAEVLVSPGDAVDAGALIARIDTDIAAADLESARLRAESTGGLAVARARVASARKRYSRAMGARDEGVITEVEFEEAEATLRIARQELVREEQAVALARSEAQRTEVLVSKGEIRAPAPGIIGENLMSAGESVGTGAVAQLIVMNPLRIEMYVPVAAVGRFREAPDEFVVLAGSGKPLVVRPKFDYISPIADRSSGTMRVYYETGDAAVYPGMRCVVVTLEQAVARGLITDSSDGPRSAGANQAQVAEAARLSAE